MSLIRLHNVQKAKIINRPSKTCKTPYVADIILEREDGTYDENDTLHQAHCPSLGCCGLCEKQSIVYVCPIEEKKKKVCSYVVYLSHFEEVDKHHQEIIGIHPKLAEQIVNMCLDKNLLSMIKTSDFRREVKMLNSRFDFSGVTQEGEQFVLEVKNVPLADYADCSKKDRKKMDFSKKIATEKISYFPDGYRKKKNDVVSPRALKHIRELEEIKKTTSIKPYICYVIQRTDSNIFQTSVMDPIYRDAVHQAIESGVNIIVIGVQWKSNGECIFIRDNYEINI